MKSYFAIVSLCGLALLATACGGGTTAVDEKALNTAVKSGANNMTNTSANGNNGSSNVAVSDGNTVAPGIPVNPAVKAESANPADGTTQIPPLAPGEEPYISPMQKAKMERLDAMRKNDKGDPNAPLRVTPMPAPENSEFTVSLTDVATETRTFKSHPDIVKVVRTLKGKVANLKVYLKNGTTVDLPPNSIKNLREIPSAQIMTLAGVPDAAPPAKGTVPIMKKSDGQ